MTGCRACEGSGVVAMDVSTGTVMGRWSIYSITWAAYLGQVKPVDCDQCEGTGSVGLEQPNDVLEQCDLLLT